MLSVMFQPGEHNAELEKAWAQLPTDSGQSRVLEQPLDAAKLLPMKTDYYRYNGSLTTPPCSEGVYWVVMKTPIEVSEAQIQHYHDLVGFDNNRPIQNKNARVILE